MGEPDDLGDLVAFLAGPDGSSQVFELVLHLKAHGHFALLFLWGDLDENSYLIGFSEGNNAARQKTKELGQPSSQAIVLRGSFWCCVRGMLSLQPAGCTCPARTILLVCSLLPAALLPGDSSPSCPVSRMWYPLHADKPTPQNRPALAT